MERFSRNHVKNPKMQSYNHQKKLLGPCPGKQDLLSLQNQEKSWNAPKEGSRHLNDLRSFIVHDTTRKTPQTLPLQDLCLWTHNCKCTESECFLAPDGGRCPSGVWSNSASCHPVVGQMWGKFIGKIHNAHVNIESMICYRGWRSNALKRGSVCCKKTCQPT